MSRSITESTAVIESQMKRIGRATPGFMNPGLTEERITAEFAIRGLRAGDDLLSLFGWHNGIRSGQGVLLNDMWLMPGYYLMAFEEALSTYDVFVNEYGENRAWFPILTTEAGCWLFVDCADASQQPVHHFTFEDEVHEMQHGSIKDMLNTIAAAYERGLFFVDGEGWFDMDYNAYWSLARELNPDSSYWVEQA